MLRQPAGRAASMMAERGELPPTTGEDQPTTTRAPTGARTSGSRTSGAPTSDARPGVTTDRDREVLRAAMEALPPLTDEQVDGLCDVILNARQRWRQLDRQPRRRPHQPGRPG
jgi:hypothetical protein